MMTVPVKGLVDTLARKDALRKNFHAMHEEWRELDVFRKMDHVGAEEMIWKGVSKQNRKWTILKSDIPAIDHTTVSFLMGDGISVTAEPKDASSPRLGDHANILERLGTSVWDWLDEERAISLQTEMTVSAVARGHLCFQYGWLTPDERGETRDTVEPQERFEIPSFPEINQPRQRVTAEGRAPVFVQVLDPLDCYWNLGKHDRVLEIVHEFRATYGQLVDLYPDLAEDRHFEQFRTASAYDTVLPVIDYWNEQINTIVVNNHEYKAPTPHGYGKCPFVVELVNPQLDRRPNDGTVTYRGTPFSLPVLEHAKALSWADSISATYMEEIAFALLQHKGIATTGPRSPHIVINPETKEAEYAAEFDFSPDARVKPMYDRETLEYLQPPRLVDMLQEFKSARIRDIQLLTYAEGILTGVYNLDISGHSVAQQKQAAMARLTPYILGINRGASRLMTNVFSLFPEEWDRIGPFLIDMLVDGIQASVPVTREMFSAVRKVSVNLKPKVPINPEAEMQFMLNAMQFNVFSLRHVQEKAGVADPSSEMKQIAFERTALQPGSPYMDALAKERFKELGMTPPPEAQPMGQPPAAPPVAGPPPAAAQGPPPGVGGPPMGMPAPGGGLPPEYMQLIQSLPPDLQQQVMALAQQDPQQAMMLLDQVMAQAQAQGGGGMALTSGAPVAAGPVGLAA